MNEQSATFRVSMSASAWADALRAYQRNVSSVLRWAHPSWLASALDIDVEHAASLRRALPPDIDGAVAGATATISRHLLRAANVAPPDLDRGWSMAAGRLDALPPALGLNVLRMRALRFRRGEVRRVVDKRTRQRLTECCGVALDALAARWPAEAAAPDIAMLAQRLPIRPLATLDADALAREGYALLRRDIAPDVCAMLRMAVSCERAAASPADAWVSALGAREATSNVRVDAQGSAMLLARLPSLLPEWAWLFG